MRKEFEYFKVTQSMDSIEIDDIGNCIIISNDDFGNKYYLIIITKLGISRIFQCGPYNNPNLSTFETVSFCQMDYDEKKISKIISADINRKNITQVQVFDISHLKNIIDDLYNPLRFLV